MEDQQPTLEDLIDQYPGWHIRPNDSGSLCLATRLKRVDVIHSPLRMTIITDTLERLADELRRERDREDQLQERAS